MFTPPPLELNSLVVLVVNYCNYYHNFYHHYSERACREHLRNCSVVVKVFVSFCYYFYHHYSKRACREHLLRDYPSRIATCN